MTYITLLLFALSSHFCLRQINKNPELYKVIMIHDSMLLKEGLNAYNKETMEPLIHDGLEICWAQEGIQSSKKTFFQVVKPKCLHGGIENS